MKKFVLIAMSAVSLVAASVPASAGQRCYIDPDACAGRIQRWSQPAKPRFFRERNTVVIREYREVRPVRRHDDDAVAGAVLGIIAGTIIGAAASQQRHDNALEKCLRHGGRYYPDEGYCER